MENTNPYAAPKAALEDANVSAGPDLAGRGQRFAAAVLDGLAFLAAGALGSLMGGGGPIATEYTPGVIVAMAAVGAVNLWTVHRWRASLGKLALGIRMVRKDGSEAELWRIVFLRWLPQGVLSAIPIANMLTLVDALFIFGSARRCVHDYIADTIVVRRA